MKKTLLVTGASSEIGQELLKEVGENYSDIFAHYNKSRSHLENIKAYIGDAVLYPVQADFSDLNSTIDFANKIIDSGNIPDDIVHLSALPIGLFSSFGKTDWNDFEQELNVSFRSAVVILQRLISFMAKRKSGRIIFMLSYNVINVPQIKNASVYSTSKYALLGLMKSLAAEYSSKGIWVNAVSPSIVETKFTQDNMPSVLLQQSANKSPIKRNLNPSDVVRPIKFLLSTESDFVTGQNIGITAGN